MPLTSPAPSFYLRAIQMSLMFLTRGTTFTSSLRTVTPSKECSFPSMVSTILDNENEAAHSTRSTWVPAKGIIYRNCYTRANLLPLLLQGDAQVKDYSIELVDKETWRVSTGLAGAWRGTESPGVLETKASKTEESDEVVCYVPPNKIDPDFDEIEDMRIRGHLFYKLDRDSREYEEYSFDFHCRKSSKRVSCRQESESNENRSRDSGSGIDKSSKNRDDRKESKKKEKLSNVRSLGEEKIPRTDKNEYPSSQLYEMVDLVVQKKVRCPTFNQLTAHYHEPFCLDIFISKASVRACIIHRATCKVVAVVHSISKDMKFDLGSTRNATACAAVGQVLAKRALADDIHNAVYTPRKGDKLEGKLQIVLQSIISNGVKVKVKLKQRKYKKTGRPSAASERRQ